MAVTVLLFIACVECWVTEGPRCHKTAGKHTEDERSCLQSTWSSVCSSGNIVYVKHLAPLTNGWLCHLFILFSRILKIDNNIKKTISLKKNATQYPEKSEWQW